LRDLAARVQALPGVEVALHVLPPRSIEVARFVADVTLMRTALGLTPPDDPLDGLEPLWTEMQAT